MKSAIVHYWLVHRRGGERVVDAIADLLPDADLISHVVDPKLLTGPLAGREVRTTFISRLPLAQRRYAAYLALMPLALEMLDMSPYELIVSSEAGPAKWVIPAPDALHICYCHTPLRYIWDQKEIYLSRFPEPLRTAAHAYASVLRAKDVQSSLRVDSFVANSNYVAKRIWRYYRRDADVVHPPVDVDAFAPSSSVDDYYLLAGEIRGYKSAAVAVQACVEMGRRLVVIGGGDNRALRRTASPLVEFRGRVSDRDFAQALSRCRALLFPGVEDFGMVPVEAMASGRPVIALARGGALDSVVHGETGLLYHDPGVEGLKAAITAFEAEEDGFSPQRCVAHAQRFSPAVFRRKFGAHLPAGTVAPVDPTSSPRPSPAIEMGAAVQ